MFKINQNPKFKEAIAVYHPDNDWEQAIQNAHHVFNPEDWLPSFACQLIAKGLANMKPGWVDNPSLYFQRASYLFSASMSAKKDTLVFSTYPLYITDIIENGEINDFIHGPIMFVSTAIAQYLFTDYPVKLYLDFETIKTDNNDVDFLDIGGLVISTGNNINISNAILSVSKNEPLRKVSATEISRDIFKIDEHCKRLIPQTDIWDKWQRRKAIIEYIGMGEAGNITIKYDNGDDFTIPKSKFDERFVVTKVADSQLVSIIVNNELHNLSEEQFGDLIKNKLKSSKVINNLFRKFGVSIDRLDDLRIEITDLDSRYAETDSKTMKLNRFLIQKDFIDKYFFVIVHEIIHYLTRVCEEQSYFNDPEEVLGFVSAMDWEIEQGSDAEQIWEKIYPKIEWHFNNEDQARRFFERSLEKAKKQL